MNRFILTLPKEQEDCCLLTTGKNTEDAITESNDDQNDDKPMILIVGEPGRYAAIYRRRELAETYRIREAANGKEAICILKDQPVSLILSDVMMPVMDGLELCNVVKNDVNFTAIFLLSC